MKTLGWLVLCEGRTLFMRDRTDILWALEDSNYKVVELVAKAEQSGALQECEESRQLLMELYLLQEEEIRVLREKLKGFEQ
jgi:hypothetical protein